jgi:CheY-like chemotaxis protein
MDHEMPKCDGAKASTEILRIARGKEVNPPDIIGITGNVSPQKLQLFQAAGLLTILTKPVTCTKLSQVMLQSR